MAPGAFAEGAQVTCSTIHPLNATSAPSGIMLAVSSSRSKKAHLSDQRSAVRCVVYERIRPTSIPMFGLNLLVRVLTAQLRVVNNLFSF